MNNTAALQKSIEKLTLVLQAGALGAPIEEREVPIWSPSDCDAECELSGVPVPSSELRLIVIDEEEYAVHPGVADYLTSHEVDIEGDYTIPDECVAVPTKVTYVAVEKQARKKGERAAWKVEDLPTLSRPALMAAAKDVGLNARCRQIGIDYRRETKEWIAAAVAKLAANPKARVPKPESEKNLKDLEEPKKKKK